MKNKRHAGVVAMLAAGGVLLSACSGDTDSGSDSGSDAAAGSDDKATAEGSAEGEFGAACDAVPKDGKGSFDGMAEDPVATAASNNPVLSTLVTAVKEAELVDTLNSAENITVFAPTNDAFGEIPEKDLNAVLADKKKLTDILTYHVVGKKITPDQLSSGKFETLQGGTLSTSGSDENFEVNDAKVVCGNVQTANATVYIIDGVMMPS